MELRPFQIAITEEQLDDLKYRLRNTRWPDSEVVTDWTQGLPIAYARELSQYWAEEYDWRSREKLLNQFPQFKADVQGLELHFIHARVKA